MKFNILYVDPPWEYKNKNTGGNIKIKKKNNSGASQKYSVMTFTKLQRLPIQKITDDNAILFLWTTISMLTEGVQLLKDWGFQYKTMLVWNKNRGYLGMGFWFRVNTEFLLVAIKGKKVKAFKSQRKNIIDHKVLRHSEKPEIFRKIIDDVSKSQTNISNIKKLEIFARKDHKNFIDDKSDWTFIGNEINKIDIIDSIEELSKK